MADIKRYGGRTYGKSPQPQESSASKSFDDVFAKPKPTKWGNVSYIKPRPDLDGMDKKQKADNEDEQDPFSFEFDCDKPSKKRQTKLHTKTVVMQPAVRIASTTNKQQQQGKQRARSGLDAEDDGCGDIFTVKKGNVRTYSKVTSRTIKEECDVKMDTYGGKKGRGRGTEHHFMGSSKGTAQGSSEHVETLSDDPDGGLYIEHDDGSSDISAQEEIFSQKDDKEDIFNRPKRDTTSSRSPKDPDAITVRFRSRYLNPEVYSKFTENVKPKDPVGSLANSKVVHKNVLKHDSGTTLIVVCSPKVGNEDIKQSHTQSKYFKDNIKDIAKSKKKPASRLAKEKKGRKPAQKDPFDMDDDAESEPGSVGSLNTRSDRDSESPLSEVVERSPAPDGNPRLRGARSLRGSKPVTVEESKSADVEEIVKTVKSAPPRKYHRIFRSRNKGFMEPTNEAEEPEVEEAKVVEEVPEKEATPEIKAEPEAEVSSQENGETETTEETVTESEPMDTQTSSQSMIFKAFSFVFILAFTCMPVIRKTARLLATLSTLNVI